MDQIFHIDELIEQAIENGIINTQVGATVSAMEFNSAVSAATQLMTKTITEQFAPVLGAEITDRVIVKLEPFGSKMCSTTYRIVKDTSGSIIGLAKSTLQLKVDAQGTVSALLDSVNNVNHLLTVGSENIGVTCNSVILGVGVYTTGVSAIGFSSTTDKKARILYTLSMMCSISAITSSSAAVVARSCQISGVGLMSESVAIAFLKLGNRARAAAYQLEGRPLPTDLQQYYDPSLRARINSGDLGFIMPGHFSSEFLDAIPFKFIGRIIGGSLAIYSYSRLVITCFRYGQKLITKYKSIRKEKLILKKARFLVSTLTRRPSVYKALISRNYRNCHSIITV